MGRICKGTEIIYVFIAIMSVTSRSNTISAETFVTNGDYFQKLVSKEIAQQQLRRLSRENVFLQKHSVMECALECSKYEACWYFVLENANCGLLLWTNGNTGVNVTLTPNDVIFKKFTGTAKFSTTFVTM